jgi:hypothetical protein
LPLAVDRRRRQNGENVQARKRKNMSLYALQKLIRDVNRRPQSREAYFQSPAKFTEGYHLALREREALLKLDMRTLYAMGVHGLLLRPFTILHKVAEPDYLKAIRGE